jgi:aminopeptidase C
MKNLEVLQISSPAFINKNIPVNILSIMIKEHHYVQYEVVYWDKLERKALWVEQSEISSDKEPDSFKIGFHKITKLEDK